MNQNYDEKLERLVEVNRQIKLLEEEAKELKNDLIDSGFDSGSALGAKITLSSRLTPKLKKDVDVEDLEIRYPQYVKFDVTKFAKDPESESYIEFSESLFLTIKEGKK